MYYAEIKTNINLDTEKAKATVTKSSQIQEELRVEYPGHTIKRTIVTPTFLHTDDVPPVVRAKYASIGDDLLGLNQYLEHLGINLKFTPERQRAWITQMAIAAFGTQ